MTKQKAACRGARSHAVARCVFWCIEVNDRFSDIVCQPFFSSLTNPSETSSNIPQLRMLTIFEPPMRFAPEAQTATAPVGCQ